MFHHEGSPTPMRIYDIRDELHMPYPGLIALSLPLSEVLRRSILPLCPPMYADNAAAGTVNPLKTDVPRQALEQVLLDPVGVNQQIFVRLDRLVYHESLLLPLLQPALDLIEDIVLDPNDGVDQLWLSKVHPEWSAVDLPRKINSEKDTEKYVSTVMIDPVIRCLQTVLAGNNLLRDYGQQGVCSGSGRGSSYPIPDILIFDATTDGVLATVEVKTHNALKSSTLNTADQSGTFRDLMDIPGLAMKFHYSDETKDSPFVTSQTKILIQIWEQLQALQVNFGVLTSFEQLVFFWRQPNSDGMYMSRQYRRNDSPLLHLFAFLACASGLIGEGKLVPLQPNTNWWSNEVRRNEGNVTGIHPKSLPVEFIRAKQAREAALASGVPRRRTRAWRQAWGDDD